jgi:rhamnulokinase
MMDDRDRPVFAAVDLGATSGRVFAGVVDGDTVELQPVHRFANEPHVRDGHLRWDLRRLYDNVLTGLAAVAATFPHLRSIGIDTWGVDYGLLDDDGALIADPIAYRDERTTAAVVDAVHARVDRAHLFDLTGLQFLPFNTIYQLAAEASGSAWPRAAKVVMLPDLIAYWLTGELRCEATIASTTGLIDIHTGRWSPELLSALDIAWDLLPPIDEPGTIRGELRSDVAALIGAPPSTVVTAVASHDTASAVAAVPVMDDRFAYVSSGTWSLVGLELQRPILTGAARDANFTNERGTDGRTRFLRNVGGLWLLEECLRSWADSGTPVELVGLLADAAALPDDGLRVDVDDPGLVAPGAMPDRIANAAGTRRLAPAAIARCVVDSLADAYARTLQTAAEVADRNVDVVHVVGGGSQNELLCRLTAERGRVPVVAGPTEATALGNVLVQARAHGEMPNSLPELRQVAARSIETRRYEPIATGAN